MVLPRELSLDQDTRTRAGSGVANDMGPELRLIVLGALLSMALIVLSLGNVGALGVLLDNLYLSVASVAAFAATIVGARSASGRASLIRRAAAVAFCLWLLANVIRGVLAMSGSVAIPSVADAFVLAMFVPGIFILVSAVRRRLTVAEEVAVYFDSALVVVLIGTVLLLMHGAASLALPSLGGVVALALPTAFIGLGATGIVASIAIRQPLAPRGGFALSAGTAMIGIAYLGFLEPTMTASVAGAGFAGLFSIGTLIAAYGAATWTDETDDRPDYVSRSRYMSRIIGPTAASVTFLALLVPLAAPVDAIVRITAFVTGTLFVIRQSLLLRERTNMLLEVRALHDENERVQGQLLNASRMAAVGELAAGVAHEVNNPLTFILGPAELLLLDLDTKDPRRRDVETIRDAALRARSIVRALSDFARPGRPELAPTDLPDLATRMTDLVRYPLTQAGVIITESHAELPLIELDPQAMQQVILNVLTNAMQAMPDGGSLRIESSIRGSEAVVTITDDGVGMDEIVVAQAFVPFYSARRAAGALGLGLSVSLGLVESHGGTIRLKSAAGAGTTVEISVPVTAADRGTNRADLNTRSSVVPA
jgi:signal transduction histidine kinase